MPGRHLIAACARKAKTLHLDGLRLAHERGGNRAAANHRPPGIEGLDPNPTIVATDYFRLLFKSITSWCNSACQANQWTPDQPRPEDMAHLTRAKPFENSADDHMNHRDIWR